MWSDPQVHMLVCTLLEYPASYAKYSELFEAFEVGAAIIWELSYVAQMSL